ncbi:KOW motif-containing protein [Candidatus Pacearchaeota archaeon]|nr:KOW motif-containing protein [Candidatus Pacearchaeota archaeon]
MKRHLKRQEAPLNWPIARKGTTFVVKNNSKGIPVLVILRDLMKIAKDRKEVKKAINKKDLIISGKPVNDEKKSLELFDVLTIIPSKKSYRLILSQKGKYDIEEVSEKDSKIKISKIIGKKSLRGKKIQLNLSDGRNCISDVKCSIGDSVIFDLEKKKISKVLPVKEKSEVLVIGGKHAGEKGRVLKVIEEQKMIEIESPLKNFRALIKQIIVLQ